MLLQNTRVGNGGGFCQMLWMAAKKWWWWERNVEKKIIKRKIKKNGFDVWIKKKKSIMVCHFFLGALGALNLKKMMSPSSTL